MINKRFNHRQVLALALPMILSNISTPLLGLVDTAVLGHLDSEQFLAAVALGGVIFSFIFWGFGFLRMGTTGLTAQAFGEDKKTEVNAVLMRALLLVLIISCFIFLFKQTIEQISFYWLKSSAGVEELALRYFEIRIWSAPATLSLYALLGWFLGQLNVRVPLLVVLVTNITNIVLDVLFVYQFNMQLQGVALASVIAEYVGFTVALLIAIRMMRKNSSLWLSKQWINASKFKAMLLINSHIFVRTWCLIFTFAFFTVQSARMGDLVLAVNAVLLNFQSFMAYALDGFAHAAEALVGKAVGAKNRVMYRQAVLTAGFWSCAVAIVFAVFYLSLGQQIIALLTGLDEVREMAYEYLPWLIAMPLVSFASYLFDGIFIGAMMTKAMRNTMLFSLFVVFLPVWYFTRYMGNHGLWLAMTVFMLARGLSMMVVYKRRER
ncbi:MAG: MATE family efflux transporter [Methylococcales bacterium]|nr:MATE family efflux transporter [Methylococcales bacterium]